MCRRLAGEPRLTSRLSGMGPGWIRTCGTARCKASVLLMWKLGFCRKGNLKTFLKQKGQVFVGPAA